jgi:hypothetical protein
MPPFGVTNTTTVPQRSKIPEGLMNYPVKVIKIMSLNKDQIIMGHFPSMTMLTRKHSFQLATTKNCKTKETAWGNQ